ncbi:MAG: phytanoyl-CoA dioxygenase family protein [Hyphomonadaceae bacterium]|nr:phytanoyl-CoA dioxygenase family protein [Hyphomonadaceae bacterium]
MAVVYINSPHADDIRRGNLFRGDLYLSTPTRNGVALIEHARAMIEEAFAPRAPETAQYEMAVEDYAALLGKLKPAFIHHPRCKDLIRAILEEHGADPEKTYFDVPKLRSSTSDAYLTTGIALAFPPHRDTWYSAPQAQINFWTPVYDITSDNGMSFYPGYIDRPVPNNSAAYNYYQWNKTRASTAEMIGAKSTRVAPGTTAPIEGEDARYVTGCGGFTIFAAAQLHASLPNTSGRTRFSIDFRVVNIDDLRSGAGAPNVDAACTGTALRDFMRATDHARLPEDLVRRYDSGEVGDGLLVYEPA